jgi:hypothetical protein
MELKLRKRNLLEKIVLVKVFSNLTLKNSLNLREAKEAQRRMQIFLLKMSSFKGII